MSGARLATGPVSWGVWLDTQPWIPWAQFLDQVVEAGYSAIELGTYGFLPIDIKQLNSELTARSLTVAGGAIVLDLVAPEVWPKSRQAIDRQAERLAATGSSYLLLVSALAPSRESKMPLTEGDWPRLIEACTSISNHVRAEWGLRLAFHPHADTAVEDEAEIDRFLELTDPSAVGLCLDVGHAAYRGVDPIAILRRHADRIEYLHLKAVDPVVRERAVRENLSFGEAVELGVFVEPDQGQIDFSELGKTLKQVGYKGWATVEQDTPDPSDAMSRAARARKFLRSVGFI